MSLEVREARPDDLQQLTDIYNHYRFGFRNVGVYTEAGRKFERYWDVLWLERTL